MKRIVLFMVASLLLPFVIHADEPSDPTFYIEVTVTSLDDAIDEPAPALLAQINERFQVYGMDVIFITTEEDYTAYEGFWYQPSLRLTFTISDDYQSLFVTPYTTMPWPLNTFTLPVYRFGANVILDSETSTAAVELIAGMAAYVVGDCETAHNAFEVVLAYPQSAGITLEAPIAFYTGNCALLEADYERAVAHFESALTLETVEFDQISTKINLTWALSQIDDSVSYLAELEILAGAYDEPNTDSTSTSSYNIILVRSRYAYALLQNNQFDQAREQIDKAIEIAQNIPELYVIRGQINLALYEWDKSFEDYSAATDLDAHYADPYFYRGILHYSILQTGLSTREDALADFEQYLRMAPHGIHAEEAEKYVESILLELDTLQNP